MFDLTTARDDAYDGRALVAAFADRDSARTASRKLQDEGFHQIWIGVTHSMSETENFESSTARMNGMTGSGLVVENANDSFADRVGRFFNGETGERSLCDELIRHGVATAIAQSIERSLEPGCAVLTVDGSNHPELAGQIIESLGGHLLAGEFFSALGAGMNSDSAMPEARRGSDVLGYGQPSRYARGREIDEERRLRLRSERLNITKERDEVGSATVRTEVIEKQNEVDIPVVREELFVERRAPGSTDDIAADATPIGVGESIRIPLMRERIAVTKRPVVTDEYVIGKRQVIETEHVSETTREERLALDEASSPKAPLPPKSTPTIR